MKQHKLYDVNDLRHDLCAWGYFTKIHNCLVPVCGLNKDNCEFHACASCSNYIHWQRFVKEKGK